jgi:uncharacterized protein (DUF1330 family)
MPAYMLIRVDADDPAQLKAYQTATPPIVEQYRGRFIVRGGASVTLEGPAETRRRLVVIEFPALSDAEAFYHSPEYAEARKLREGIGRFEFVAVEGVKL